MLIHKSLRLLAEPTLYFHDTHAADISASIKAHRGLHPYEQPVGKGKHDASLNQASYLTAKMTFDGARELLQYRATVHPWILAGCRPHIDHTGCGSKCKPPI
jgi:hypothetical protein